MQIRDIIISSFVAAVFSSGVVLAGTNVCSQQGLDEAHLASLIGAEMRQIEKERVAAEVAAAASERSAAISRICKFSPTSSLCKGERP